MKDPGVVPTPLPEPVDQMEGHVDVGDGHQIWYFDTGGTGAPLVMLHADTGSGLVWGYQQPVFSAAGLRVVGYSRRGRQESIMGDPEKPGIGSEDLLKLADHLKLDRFHLLGTAAGGMIATDFAVSHEGRLLSLILANTIVGITNDDYQAIYERIWPEEFAGLPSDFKELGPSYRHLDVEGRRLWNRIVHHARIGAMGSQTFANKVVWDHLAAWKLPVLLVTGDADLYTPPSMMRLVASRINGAESFLIPDCGHSGYWERPEIFNRLVLDFIKRHDRA
jgi:pimeloyl-ACP methyl ester carboxylesterase